MEIEESKGKSGDSSLHSESTGDGNDEFRLFQKEKLNVGIKVQE